MPSSFTLPKVFEHEIEALVRAGYYSSTSDMITDALRRLFESKSELKLGAAIEMYISEEISMDRAAEIAGMGTIEFKELLIERQIPIRSYIPPQEELDAGVELIRKRRSDVYS